GPAGSDPAKAASQRPGPPEGDRPRSVLANSVAGQARDVAAGSLSGPGRRGAGGAFPVGPSDPPSRRAGAVAATQVGNTAMGFATEGDWVEVNGKPKGGFLNVQAAFNHTSGAQFRRRYGCMGAGMVIMVLSLILFMLMIAVIAGSTSIIGALST